MDQPLTGLIAATFSPMCADGTLNLNEVPKMVAHLERSGIKGLYICGSTGEGMSLSGKERRELAEAYVACAKGRLTTIVHVGHNSLSEARQLAQHAREIGADVISATAPSYYKIDTVEMLIKSMEEVASGASELPFYYYHIPSLTGAALDMTMFMEKASKTIPNLKGLKYTAQLIHEFQSCQEMMGGRFDVVWGTDEMLLSALVIGAKGAIGSTYNISAPLNNQLIEAFDRGDLEQAKQLQMLSVQLVELLKKYPFHAAVKSILSRFGIECGGCRIPLLSLTGDQENQLHRDLDESEISKWLFDQKRPDLNGTISQSPRSVVPASHISGLVRETK